MCAIAAAASRRSGKGAAVVERHIIQEYRSEYKVRCGQSAPDQRFMAYPEACLKAKRLSANLIAFSRSSELSSAQPMQLLVRNDRLPVVSQHAESALLPSLILSKLCLYSLHQIRYQALKLH
jgi:hypothetical protein